jgi:molybdate transport system regulatory protein
MDKLRVKSKFWIEAEDGGAIFGGGRLAILDRVDQLGSIKAAADDLKMSYRAVWGKIKTAEKRLGIRLLETSPGGGPRRGARLTDEAREFIARYRELCERGNLQADKLFKEIFNRPDGKKSWRPKAQ